MSKKKSVVTQSITHIRLSEVNQTKLDKLNALARVYKDLCQEYVTAFCTEVEPDKYIAPFIQSQLSHRWQRVAIMQATGIAQSWWTNRNNAFDAYQRKLAQFEKKYPTEAERKANRNREPQWQEFTTPELKATNIQANHNVVQLTNEAELPLKLEQSKGQGFDFWLRISTLDKGKPLWLPVKLANYHREKLAGHLPNSSVQLNHHHDGTWRLTISFDETIAQKETQSEPIGIDVGINNFLTSSTGKQYGTFRGDLARRFEQDREKRRRKAKLRACLEKKGVENLPSTSSTSGQKLRRHVLQSINKAVKDYFCDHPDSEVVIEDLSVSSMRFKSRRMNAQLYASHLGHIPQQIQWVALKRGIAVHKVNPAYSSQECYRCHHTHRDNRPTQQTFCCQVCAYRAEADEVAAKNVQRRLHDQELAACKGLAEVKELLLRRHQAWCEQHGYP